MLLIAVVFHGRADHAHAATGPELHEILAGLHAPSPGDIAVLVALAGQVALGLGVGDGPRSQHAVDRVGHRGHQGTRGHLHLGRIADVVVGQGTGHLGVVADQGRLGPLEHAAQLHAVARELGVADTGDIAPGGLGLLVGLATGRLRGIAGGRLHRRVGAGHLQHLLGIHRLTLAAGGRGTLLEPGDTAVGVLDAAAVVARPLAAAEIVGDTPGAIGEPGGHAGGIAHVAGDEAADASPLALRSTTGQLALDVAAAAIDGVSQPQLLITEGLGGAQFEGGSGMLAGGRIGAAHGLGLAHGPRHSAGRIGVQRLGVGGRRFDQIGRPAGAAMGVAGHTLTGHLHAATDLLAGLPYLAGHGAGLAAGRRTLGSHGAAALGHDGPANRGTLGSHRQTDAGRRQGDGGTGAEGLHHRAISAHRHLAEALAGGADDDRGGGRRTDHDHQAEHQHGQTTDQRTDHLLALVDIEEERRLGDDLTAEHEEGRPQPDPDHGPGPVETGHPLARPEGHQGHDREEDQQHHEGAADHIGEEGLQDLEHQTDQPGDQAQQHLGKHGRVGEEIPELLPAEAIAALALRHALHTLGQRLPRAWRLDHEGGELASQEVVGGLIWRRR